MFKTMTTVLATLTVIFATVGLAQADEVNSGDLVLNNAMIKATPPKAPVAGGFLTIANNGKEDDRLIGAKVEFAGKVEIHEMKMDGDVMRMRQIEGGLVIPAGGEAVLKPGGNHVMFMRLKEQMKEGETRRVTLQFEKAGDVAVEFKVGMPMKHMN